MRIESHHFLSVPKHKNRMVLVRQPNYNFINLVGDFRVCHLLIWIILVVKTLVAYVVARKSVVVVFYVVLAFLVFDVFFVVTVVVP